MSRRIALGWVLLSAQLLGVSFTACAEETLANPAVTWEAPIQVPSPPDRSAWFPDLAVDHEKRVHVVWSVTNHRRMRDTEARKGLPPWAWKDEELYYARLDGGRWSAPAAIVPLQLPIVRSAIAVDDRDILHVLFNYCPGSGHDLYYRQAPADEGLTLGHWQAAQAVNARWSTYMSNIAAHGDTVHILYDDSGAVDAPCRGCGDIYYRHSLDRGASWSEPMSLRPSGSGSSRPQMTVDAAGTVYAVWDEGWDRWSGAGTPEYGVYMYSPDGGSTWSTPVLVSYPRSSNVQLSVGTTGSGGVMLVWRTVSPEFPGIYYMWSTDWGETWSTPQTLPGLAARGWNSPFDIYDMAADATGQIHLLATAEPAPQPDAYVSGTPPVLYHLAWNGEEWSEPTPVYAGHGYPEYPHVVVDGDDELHATWFVRAEAVGDAVPHQVWYAHGSLRRTLLLRRTPIPAPRVVSKLFVPRTIGTQPAPQSTEPADTRLINQDALVLLLLCIVGGTLLVAAVDLGRRVRGR
jgi:hypothetical protein